MQKRGGMRFRQQDMELSTHFDPFRLFNPVRLIFGLVVLGLTVIFNYIANLKVAVPDTPKTETSQEAPTQSNRPGSSSPYTYYRPSPPQTQPYAEPRSGAAIPNTQSSYPSSQNPQQPNSSQQQASAQPATSYNNQPQSSYGTQQAPPRIEQSQSANNVTATESQSSWAHNKPAQQPQDTAQEQQNATPPPSADTTTSTTN